MTSNVSPRPTQPSTLPHPPKNTPQDRVACIQALSGTGALRVGAAFAGKFMKGTKVFISNPTWGESRHYSWWRFKVQREASAAFLC